MKEDLWFKQQQRLLLWLANTKEGRALLCIKDDFPPIVEISKCHIKGFIGFSKGKLHYMSAFHSGSKWANIIRYRWKEFQQAAQWYYMNELASSLIKKPIFMPVAPIPGYTYLTNTSFPDPDPETSTVDGVVWEGVTETLWGTVRGGTGTNANDTADDVGLVQWVDGTTTDRFTQIRRSITLFDTSGIGATSTIDSATLAIRGSGSADAQSNVPEINIYTSTPAANTSLAIGDYAQIATVAQATAITFTNWSTTLDNTFTLNATGLTNISKTGITKFGQREAKFDVANVAPVWASPGSGSFGALLAETVGTGDDPTLTVQYTAAGGAVVPNSMLALLGVG